MMMMIMMMMMMMMMMYVGITAYSFDYFLVCRCSVSVYNH